MTGNEKIFLGMDKNSSKVRLGNGALVQAKGMGTIFIETKRGKRYIHEVLFVPDIEENLLSVGQLIENGYHLHFGDYACKIFDKNKQFIAHVFGIRSFPIEFHYEVWHKRFCHLNFHGLKLLMQKGMVHGLPEIDIDGEECIMGKQARLPFPKGRSWRYRY